MVCLKQPLSVRRVAWLLTIVLCLCASVGLVPPVPESSAVTQGEPTLVQSPGVESLPPASAAPERRRSTKIFIPDRVRDVLAALQERKGVPLPGYVGGRTFENRERRLPAGRYREYDVHPKVPGKNRGAERLVIEQRTGKAYYTQDHYRTFTLVE